ncbi:hypothetical protein HOLleu_18058 [Holothuria leucospilota]|uniref:Uncharacterized protein n=1 Tax=Holothuria leucospilota TaxID=206669 RepID=A0A9Q1C179_HOLLE|nr:hypothetical protein HOLleu_18058 [Holothuria leucospilota]
MFAPFLLTLLLCLSVFCIMYVLLKLRNQQGGTTELVLEITYFLFIASNSFAVLCCKFKCTFSDQLSLFGWASMLNARYIIKRAQLLDMQSSGLPGKFFLFLCIFWPLINSCLRCVMFLTFTEPQEGVTYIRALMTCIVGLLLMETWGIFTYILYIVRISFQRHFSLLLSFVEEREGQIDICRGVLLEVITDFAYFRRFTKAYILIMLPVAFIGMASNLSWGYLMDNGCGKNEEVAMVQTFISALAWSQIIMGVFLFMCAQGAVDIMYLWDNFFRDVIKLHSDLHDQFWHKMIRCMSLVPKNETSLFLVSVIFSVIGVYMALNIQNQDISYLARGCNVTNETSYG